MKWASISRPDAECDRNPDDRVNEDDAATPVLQQRKGGGVWVGGCWGGEGWGDFVWKQNSDTDLDGGEMT